MSRRPPSGLTPDEIVEDAAFMADQGAGLTEAARRTGTTVPALEILLYRRDQHELVARLRGQNPAGADVRAARLTRHQEWARTPEGQSVLRQANAHLDYLRANHPEDPVTVARRRALLDHGIAHDDIEGDTDVLIDPPPLTRGRTLAADHGLVVFS